MEHLTDKEFDRICAHLSRTLGLNMRSKRVLLDCRLSRERNRLGLPSLSAYLDLIESGDDPAAVARFIDLVTTHYSYFLRESGQFDFLRDTALPELERAHPGRTWSILCAGCATGEECYTMSMLVEDFARHRDIPPVRITGIDVSAPALEEARRGVYSPSRIEKTPARWRAAYFERDGEGYAVAERIRKRVSFVRGNLIDPETLRRRYDLILCRNVIIYFDKHVRDQVLYNLHSRLSPSGYLVLGHAEIVRDRALFAYCGHSIYQKQPEAIQS